MSHNAKQPNKRFHNIRHNTIRIDGGIKCPSCFFYSKDPMKVKSHKNLSSLDSHISTEHKGEFWIKEAQLLIRQFSEAIST